MTVSFRNGVKITDVTVQEIIKWVNSDFSELRGENVRIGMLENRFDILAAMVRLLIWEFRKAEKNEKNLVAFTDIIFRIIMEFFKDTKYLSGESALRREKNLASCFIEKALPENLIQDCMPESQLKVFESFYKKTGCKSNFKYKMKIPGETIGYYRDDLDRCRPITSRVRYIEDFRPVIKVVALTLYAAYPDWLVA